MGGKIEKNLLSGNEEEQKQQWIEELQQQDFFKRNSKAYTAVSVESWLKSYTDHKYQWLKFLEHTEQRYEQKGSQWLDMAQHHLEAIQQKKLFDLQCRWRAEEIKLPGIEICFDFAIWEEDVLNCPFLEPITAEELDLYLQYLQHPDANPYCGSMCMGFGWQDYDQLQEAIKDNDAIPEWYEYHNQYTGASQLLVLPNIRGLKERRYHHLTIDARNEAFEAKALAENRVRDDRPILFSDDEVFMEQALNYEGPLVRRAKEMFEWWGQRNESEEFISDMVSDLMEADEPVPIEAHSNWLEALKKTHRRYQCRMIAEALPQAYEQYCMNIEMGIVFPTVDNRKDQQWLRDLWVDNILAGRRVAGEKEDFDF